jgi:hypothetical protein
VWTCILQDEDVLGIDVQLRVVNAGSEILE